MRSDAHPADKWLTMAAFAVAGILVFSLGVGLVLLPMAQARNAQIGDWLAICRAIGISPGTPAQPQPPVSATAAPVSQVEWSPRTLQILASADPRPGAALAQDVCSACHGAQGMSITAQFPRLAGQSPEAIYKQLSDYRSDARSNEQMTQIAKALTQDQLAEVASYFGHIHSGVALGDAYLAIPDEHINRLINLGDPVRRIPPCQGCHAQGVGGPVEAPVLVGQNSEYIERQLLAYKSGQRRNDVYRRMRDIAQNLTADEIKRLARAYEGVY